ncbi:MAG: efflux RND transporter periplasmic adaptor subunit [Acidobacteria bacterium]|nr:efflux RND transporter periplasmic adaptor subunit [Acidobacteriota bacterium]
MTVKNDVEESVTGRRRRVWAIGLIGLVGILVLGFAVGRFMAGKPDQSKAAEATAAATATATPEPLVEVTTVAAITRNLQRSVEVVGSLAADEEVVIASQAAGELAQLNVDFGSFITQGQTIAIIDQRDAKLKVEQAEATLKQTMARLGIKKGEKFDPLQAADVKVAKAALDWAKLDLDRAAKLIENGDISRSVYDQAMINHNSAQARYQAAADAINQQLALLDQQRASLALAKKAITDTVVRAPISGAVKEKFASKGTYLPVNGKIVTIVRINPLRLRADIPEYAAGSVRVGQTINLSVDSFPNRTFSGKVARIGPSLNEQTRALTVEAAVTNPGNILRPGMFAKSRLITAADAKAVMVPMKAVLTVAGLNKLFVIENGKATERLVKLGDNDGDLVEIREGLKEGEMVASSNQDKLHSGTPVR